MSDSSDSDDGSITDDESSMTVAMEPIQVPHNLSLADALAIMYTILPELEAADIVDIYFDRTRQLAESSEWTDLIVVVTLAGALRAIRAHHVDAAMRMP
jgi:hypothetical protein